MTEEVHPWNDEHVHLVKEGPTKINAWRDQNPLARLNLAFANLSGVNLQGADLVDANLSGAGLVGTDLGNASLDGAYMAFTDLRAADLNNASLKETQLIRANLEGANLKDAAVGSTIFGTDISQATNIESIHHHGHSQISHDALLRPRNGPLPIKFLRGIGLTDTEIEFARAISSNPIEFYSAFISYHAHGSDDKFAVKLHDALQARGARCWLDKHEVRAGDDFLEEINRGIQLWDKILLLCSKESLNSDWVQAEVERAFKKERDLKKTHGSLKLILPIDLDGYLFSDKCDFKFAADLQLRNAVILHDWERDETVFDTQLERIVKALRSDDLARVPPPDSKLKPREQPGE